MGEIAWEFWFKLSFWKSWMTLTPIFHTLKSLWISLIVQLGFRSLVNPRQLRNSGFLLPTVLIWTYWTNPSNLYKTFFGFVLVCFLATFHPCACTQERTQTRFLQCCMWLLGIHLAWTPAALPAGVLPPCAAKRRAMEDCFKNRPWWNGRLTSPTCSRLQLQKFCKRSDCSPIPGHSQPASYSDAIANSVPGRP